MRTPEECQRYVDLLATAAKHYAKMTAEEHDESELKLKALLAGSVCQAASVAIKWAMGIDDESTRTLEKAMIIEAIEDN